MTFWYVARPNEIFLDLDSPRSVSRAMAVLRRALQVKRKASSPVLRLDVKSVWLYPSGTPGHAHLIIVLHKRLSFFTRVCWSLWMGADKLRAAYVIQRYFFMCDEESDTTFAGSFAVSELLCSTTPYEFRKEDDSCNCGEKHKPKHVTDACPALRRILGSQRSADYFPRNRDRKKRGPVRFAWGQVPLENIRQWRSNAR